MILIGGSISVQVNLAVLSSHQLNGGWDVDGPGVKKKKKCPEDLKTSHGQQSVYFRLARASTSGAITVKTGSALEVGVVMNNSSSFFVGRFRTAAVCCACVIHY